MPKYRPTVEGMIVAVKKAVDHSLHGTKKHKGTSISSDITASLRVWAKEYEVGFVAQGKEIIDRGASKYIVYLNPLEGKNPLFSRVASSTCVISIMRLNSKGVWRPDSAIIYDPAGRQIWTTERDRGVKYRDLDTNSVNLLPIFEPEDLSYETIRIHIANWTRAKNIRKDIYDKLSTLNKFVILNSGSSALAAGHMTLDVDGIHGCVSTESSARENAPISIFIEELGGIATDVSGKLIKGFRYARDPVDHERIAADFISDGLILANSQHVLCEIKKALD